MPLIYIDMLVDNTFSIPNMSKLKSNKIGIDSEKAYQWPESEVTPDQEKF